MTSMDERPDRGGRPGRGRQGGADGRGRGGRDSSDRRQGSGSGSARPSRPSHGGSGRDRRGSARPDQRGQSDRRGQPDRRGGSDEHARSESTYTGRRADRANEPAVPQDVDPAELDPQVRAELRSLTKPVAERVARHLVAAGHLVDEDPETALAHARAARRLGGRLAVVREAVAISAYHAGEWSEALGELRAARRMGGAAGLVHVMADCERALGRPERALALASETPLDELPLDERVEMLLVIAGARRDLGELDAALLTLHRPELESDRPGLPTLRLQYAYADALEAAGRRDGARTWFARAVENDPEETTDAAERLRTLG